MVIAAVDRVHAVSVDMEIDDSAHHKDPTVDNWIGRGLDTAEQGLGRNLCAEDIVDLDADKAPQVGRADFRDHKDNWNVDWNDPFASKAERLLDRGVAVHEAPLVGTSPADC